MSRLRTFERPSRRSSQSETFSGAFQWRCSPRGSGLCSKSMTIPSDREAIGYVAQAARRSLSVRRVVLFGSRARGDARPDSDVDIAVVHDSDDAAWSDFVNQMQETAPTLLELDIVDYLRAPEALRRRIDEEGVTFDG